MMKSYCFEDLYEGLSSSFSKTITEADILLFSGVSGDTNPVHIDANYAAKTPFKGRIAHGMLYGSLISAVLGTKMPGPGCIYLSQSLRFTAPVRINDTVTATVTVISLNPTKKQANFRTFCTVDDKLVIEGEALIQIPSRIAHTAVAAE